MFFKRDELHDLLGLAETVFDQADHHRAAEVLIHLRAIDVLCRDAGHLEEPRCQRLEVRRCVIGGVLDAGVCGDNSSPALPP